MFKPEDSDREEDFFNAPVPPERPKPPKPPVLKPDDPRYYDSEDEWEHIRPAARKWKMWLWIAIIGIAIGAAYSLCYYIFVPATEQNMQYGYVESIRQRNDGLKTFEGVIIPYKAINDTIEPYSGDIVFSTNSDHLAGELRRLQYANLPARIEYSEYRIALPWNGKSRIVITAVDTADVTKIWPATLNHPLIPTPPPAE